MSRSRAAIFRGAGYQPSKQQRRYEARQQVRVFAEAEPEQPTLAERVLPWRRRKAKRAAQEQQAYRDHVETTQQREAKAVLFRREHRVWRGIHAFPQRQMLARMALVAREENRLGVARVYRDPQQRRIARELRCAKGDALTDDTAAIQAAISRAA